MNSQTIFGQPITGQVKNYQLKQYLFTGLMLAEINYTKDKIWEGFFRSCNALHDCRDYSRKQFSVLTVIWCGWYCVSSRDPLYPDPQTLLRIYMEAEQTST